MRKIASIQTISKIQEHSNADTLELAFIKGWQVIVKKGEFQPGDKVVYFEIDSWIPHEIAPFLSKGKEPRLYEGIAGEKLRTVRLRGELSQGLILPMKGLFDSIIEEDTDVSEALGVIKWEPVIPAQLAGQVMGNFPSFIPKTDQERCQNIFQDIQILDQQNNGIFWELSEKLDGSSCTFYVRFHPNVAEGYYEQGICSRNLELKISEENAHNTFIKVVTESGYLEHGPKLGKSLAIQGELCGPGIQGNKYQLTQPVLFVFDVYLIDEHRYATHLERLDLLNSLIDCGVSVNQVPVIGLVKTPKSLNDCLTMAEGKSLINPKIEREGVVFKSIRLIDGQVQSFKSISNQFLLKNNE